MTSQEMRATLDAYQALPNWAALNDNARFMELYWNASNQLAVSAVNAAPYLQALAAEFPLTATAVPAVVTVVSTQTLANGDKVTTYSDGSQSVQNHLGVWEEDTGPTSPLPLMQPVSNGHATAGAGQQPQTFSPLLLIGLAVGAYFLLKD